MDRSSSTALIAGGLFAFGLMATTPGAAVANPVMFQPFGQSTNVVNTNNPHYLPIALGNKWTFNNPLGFGANPTISDLGPVNIGNTSCIGTNCKKWVIVTSDERLDINGPFGYLGTLYVRKARYLPTNHLLTTVSGESNNGGSSVTKLYDNANPVGVPFMDDVPSPNEQWSDTTLGASAKILSVGSTQPYNSKTINNVATENLSSPKLSLTMRLAKGVGFTRLVYQGYTFDLTNFAINAASSKSYMTQPRYVLVSKQFDLSWIAGLIRH